MGPDYDWPLPTAKTFPAHLRTFTKDTPLNLIGQDTFFAGPGMGPDYDWPLPSRKPFPIDLRFWSQGDLLSTLLAPAGASPFQQLDWPLPIPKSFPATLRTFTEATKLNLIGQDTFFAGPGVGPTYDWPLPTRKPLPISLRHWDQGDLLSTLLFPLGTPFYQLDWPVPANSAARGPTLRTWLDATKIHLIGKDKFFGDDGQPPANLDWPVPKGYSYPISLRTGNQPLTVISFPVAGPGPSATSEEEHIDVWAPSTYISQGGIKSSSGING